MQDIKQAVRALGAQLQLSPEYVRFVAAKEANDADDALGGQMQQLELLRMQYAHEASKQEADQALMEDYDKQFQALYNEIMDNPNMQQYRVSSDALNALLKWTASFLQGCAQGEDPQTYEPAGAGGCSGSCEGCAGCN